MKLARKAGATSQIFQVFIQDSSSTTGAGLTGLVFNSASLTAYYHRDTDTTATVITLVTMTVGTFTSSGFAQIDATNMPGFYQLCIPNAALASGASSVVIHLKGATNMAPLPIEVDLDAQVDVTFWNGTVVATPATAGIPDVNAKNVNNVATTSITTINANLGTTQPTNYTGTGASALVKSDMVDVAGAAVSTATAQLGVNVVNINNVAAATPGASGGVLISGSNAGTTTLAALTVTGSMTVSDGLLVSRSSANSSAITATGNGTGSGIVATSGAGVTGDGLRAVAASTNGSGLTGVKTGTGSDLNATVTPLVLAKTTNITGFNDIAATAVVSAGAITTSGGKVSGVILTDTVTTYTGNTVQTGDAFARIGVAGAGLTALGDTRIANLDAAVSSRMATYAQPSGFLAATFPGGTVASTTNIASGTITTVTNQLTAAQVATGVWQDATAGDFTTVSSIGKSLYTSGVVPGAAGGLFIAGSNAGTTVNLTGNLSGSVGSVTGLTAANLDVAVSTRTKPADTQAAVTTVTNLTNAPTAGDFTATMKTSMSTTILTTALTESYAAKGAVPTLTQALLLLPQIFQEQKTNGAGFDVYKIDGVTKAATYTWDSATAPTTVTRTT